MNIFSWMPSDNRRPSNLVFAPVSFPRYNATEFVGAARTLHHATTRQNLWGGARRNTSPCDNATKIMWGKYQTIFQSVSIYLPALQAPSIFCRVVAWWTLFLFAPVSSPRDNATEFVGVGAGAAVSSQRDRICGGGGRSSSQFTTRQNLWGWG